MTVGRRTPPLTSILAGIALVFGVNYYVIRDVFHVIDIGHMNSMQGFWMAMARLADAQWFHPGWWPWWDSGAPFEFTYAPLTPALTALWSHFAAIPVSQAFYCVTALYYVLGPVALFAFAAWLTRSVPIATATGLIYSLLSPASLLVPDDVFRFSQLLSDRRAYLMGIWDDTPHLGALVFLPVLWIFVGRAILRGMRRDVLISILLVSLEVTASAFGPVLFILSAVCLLIAFGRDAWPRKLTMVGMVGLTGYLIAMPWLPLSLVSAIQSDAAMHDDNVWGAPSFTALCAVLLLWVLLWRVLRPRTDDPAIHCAAFLGLVMGSIPLVWFFGGRSFVPQPGRYRFEMDLAWALPLALTCRFFLRKMPRSVMACVIALLVSLGAEQVVNHRRYAKQVFFPADIRQTLDYKEAAFIHTAFPPQSKIFLSGSTAEWFNRFSDNPQFGGSSYSTAYNPIQQMGLRYIYIGDKDGPHGGAAILWLEAFGVSAISVPGSKSPETWHPFRNADQFEGLLDPVWKESDTTLYRLPLRSDSPAHVVNEDAVVARAPRSGGDIREIARFVGDLQNPSLPLAQWQWSGPDHATVDTDVGPHEVISMQVSFHPGWHARANGVIVPMHRDGLGLMWMKPPAAGHAHVELSYDGGGEMLFGRIASWVALALAVGWAIFGSLRSRQRPASSVPPRTGATL